MVDTPLQLPQENVDCRGKEEWGDGATLPDTTVHTKAFISATFVCNVTSIVSVQGFYEGYGMIGKANRR